MRRALLVFAVSIAPLLATGVARPQPDPADAAEPVMKQLEAFRRGDYDAAYSFASASIRELFDRGAFEEMVRSGYPEIANFSSARVVESLVGPDGHVYVRVKIRGANENNIEAVYDLVREDGRLRINGVVARPDPGLV